MFLTFSRLQTSFEKMVSMVSTKLNRLSEGVDLYIAKKWIWFKHPAVLIHNLDKFAVASLDNFVGEYSCEMLLYLIRAIRKCLSKTVQYCPGCANLFISVTKKKWMAQNTIVFWVRSVIHHAYGSAIDEDCRSVVKAHKI